MPCKDKETARASQHKWYQSHKEERRKQIHERSRKIYLWFMEYKTTLKCENCGEDEPCCLDFHHTNPEDKVHTIKDYTTKGYSKKRILEELSKCRILCSNCHRKEHKRLRESNQDLCNDL